MRFRRSLREPWSTPQRQWLQRIAAQTKANVVVDRDAIDDPDLIFRREGGGFANDIVSKLWNLCNVLKEGVTYHQYVTELTYLLFLKMAKETGAENHIPAGHRRDDLVAKAAPKRLDEYRATLVHLGSNGSRLVKEIYANASSFVRKPTACWRTTGKFRLGNRVIPKKAIHKTPDCGANTWSHTVPTELDPTSLLSSHPKGNLGGAMKAKQVIEGATLGPEALKAIGEAFDQAWADVDDVFAGPLAKEVARLYLANAMLAVATDDSRDVDALRSHGLSALALKYPQTILPRSLARRA